MDETEARFSPAWWESLTGEQLQEMTRGGLEAGEYGAGAHREIERRARERARLEQQETEVQKKGFRLRTLTVLEVLMLIALLIMLLIR